MKTNDGIIWIEWQIQRILHRFDTTPLNMQKQMLQVLAMVQTGITEVGTFTSE
jgi:hypothetical protein